MLKKHSRVRKIRFQLCLWQDLKAKLFAQTYKTLEDMQAKVTEIPLNYSDAVIAKLTGFSQFTKAANAI